MPTVNTEPRHYGSRSLNGFVAPYPRSHTVGVPSQGKNRAKNERNAPSQTSRKQLGALDSVREIQDHDLLIM